MPDLLSFAEFISISRNPHEAIKHIFDEKYYREAHDDLKDVTFDLFDHYIRFGEQEGRKPCLYFDPVFYLKSNPDVAQVPMSALLHYCSYGAVELRAPSPDFDPAYYVDAYPNAERNPLLFQIYFGKGLGYDVTEPFVAADCLPRSNIGMKSQNSALVTKFDVAVVIPVYKGAVELDECLESIFRDRRIYSYKVLLINDKSPEAGIIDVIDKWRPLLAFSLIQNTKNEGFVKSVNKGMMSCETDVVLLNSDTVVPEGWLARLVSAAYSSRDIATVCPMSNSATVCSYPFFGSHALAFGSTLDAMDAAFASANKGRVIKIPTTIGYCMYIKRSVLNSIGIFDEATFGHGYGEEVDFCMRASRAGLSNVVCCDLFVYHRGEVSFGKNSPHRKAGEAAIEKRYPEYNTLIARFVRRDPLKMVRLAATIALLRDSPKKTILHISHAMGGGVSDHILKLSKFVEPSFFSLCLVESSGHLVLSFVNADEHRELRVPLKDYTEIFKVLDAIGINKISLHHCVGWSLDIRLILFHYRRIGYDLTIHDYFFFCPKTNLIRITGEGYCGEPDERG